MDAVHSTRDIILYIFISDLTDHKKVTKGYFRTYMHDVHILRFIHIIISQVNNSNMSKNLTLMILYDV